MKTKTSQVLMAAFGSLFAVTTASADLVGPYSVDPNTLHLWHMDEANPGPAAPAAGVTGSFNLTPDAGKSPGFPATLGNTAFAGFGTAGNTAAGQGSGFKGSSVLPGTLTGADGQFTFEAMINVSTTAGVQMIIAMDNNNANAQRPFHFRISNGALAFINIAAGGSPPTATIPTTGPDAFAAGEWFHVAVTYTGDPVAANNFKYYWTKVDATRTRANEILSTTMTNDIGGVSTILGVGNDYRTSGTGNTSNLEGSIDEVRISNIARAADEMLFGGPDLTPPTLLSTTPADDATLVPISANFVANFDEAIQAGTGSITLKRTSNNSVVEAFDVTSSDRLTFAPLSVTIDPTNDLLPGVEYYILIDNTAIEDVASNPYAGISDPTAWSFTTDGTAPVVASLGPVDDAPDALLTSCLTLGFDEAVQVGTGSITVHLASDNSVVESIAVTSGAVSISGSVVTIAIGDLAAMTSYYVNIPSGALLDLSGNPFGGISGTTAWSFTTAAVVAPIVPYGVDANTLHLWHFNDAHPGPATPALGVTGSFNLTPAGGAVLGAEAFTNLGGAGDLSANLNSVLTGASITSSALTGGDGAFTFEAIVKLSTIGVEQHVMTMSNTGGTQVLQLRTEAPGSLRFVKVNGVNGTDNDQLAVIPTTGPDGFVPNKWFHVAVSYNGVENTADNCKLYWTRVDPSRSVANEIGSFTLNGDLDTTTSIPFRVGNRSVGVALRGSVDEVRISNIARAANEMFLGTGVADVTAPTVVAVAPADDAVNVPTVANLTATFDEEIVAGAGFITLKRSSDNSTVESFDVASSPQLSFGLYSVTIDPTADLLPGVEYYVVSDAGAVEDYLGNGAVAISDPTLWSFTTDGTAPMSTAMGPMAAATGVSPRTNLTLSFDEAVLAGSGEITLHLASDNSVVATIDVTDALAVVISGSEVTINLPSQLAGLTGYYINIDAGAFKDLSGNSAAGISDTTTWAFTTGVIPEGRLFSEDFAGSTGDLDGLTPDTTINGAPWVASANFNENGSIDQGQGSATLAFTPFNGLIYTLEASLTGVTGNNNWLGLGFAKGQSNSSTSNDRFITGTVVGRAWMLLRGDASINSNQAFLGTGGPDGGLASTVAWSAFTSENPGGDMDLRIVLDTTGGPGTWTATWFAKRPADAGYTIVRAAAPLLNEDIDSVGLALPGPGVFGMIESFRLSTGDPNAQPLVLKIAQSAGNLDFEWNSLSGMQYDLVNSTDLNSNPTTWLPYNDGVTTYENIASTGTGVQTLTGVLKVGPVRFFALIEEEIPPLLVEDFDADNGGFTIAVPNLGTGTEWSWGMPNSPDQGGGAVLADNGGSGSCWGTNLLGGYAAGTDASLRSGIIDLTGMAGASLSFALFLDAAAGHTYEVNIIDDTTDAFIASVIAATEDAAPGSAWATVGPVAIPAAALGQAIRIEWRFTGNGDGTYNGAYLDDVVVVKTAP